MGKIKDIFRTILAQDMAKQARLVEIGAIIVFVVLLIVVWWLWQFQIEITVPIEEGRKVIAKMNIFELLLSKK